MSYNATVFRVMVASPRDVIAERSVVREVLQEWNIVHSEIRKMVLLPVGWETHVFPSTGEHPQAIINKQILRNCDLLIGVFWTRIGTATDDYASGTVEEIEEHIKSDKPVMLYFSSAPVLPDSVDSQQYSQLKAFRESCKSRAIYETYSDLNDFRSKLYRQLQLKLNKDEYFGQPVDQPAVQLDVEEPVQSQIPSLSREAQTLLKEASKDPTGTILCLVTTDGFHIQTNKKDFVGSRDPRARATWEGALRKLEYEDLVIARGHKREIFALTDRGYEMAELVNP